MELRQGGPRPRAPARARRRADVRGAAASRPRGPTRPGRAGTSATRRASAAGRGGCGTACCGARRCARRDAAHRPRAVRRLRAAADAGSPCSRRAPAPARRSRSPRSRRATSRTGRRSTTCCWSRSRGWRPASCASACASGWRAPSAALGAVLEGAAPDARDEVVRLLADGPAPRRSQLRRRRLARALADFDAATITTTHGFCQEVLGGLGVAGDVDRATAPSSRRSRDLLEEVVDDLYVRRFRPDGRARRRSRARRRCQVARDRGRQPGRAGRAAGRRRAAARDAPAPRRGRARRARAAQAAARGHDLRRPADPAAARRCSRRAAPRSRARLHARYPVVLVDEFQDTDPIQWEILADGVRRPGTLVLIGDPKQAIYAFRGADVYAYLDAARVGRRARDAARSTGARDQGLIDAYDALFGGAQLGHEGIVYRRVRAADANRAPRLTGAPGAPLRVRVVHRDEPAVERTPRGFAKNASARALHRPRPRGRRRPAARRGRGDRDARRRRRRARAAPRSRPATSPCSCARTAPPPRSATRSTPPGVPAVINGAGSVFGDRRRGPLAAAARGAGAARPPARARTPPRSRRSSAGRAERVAVRRGAGVGGGPPPAARLGARAAPARRRRRWWRPSASPRGSRARALAARRRARADRPAPRRASCCTPPRRPSSSGRPRSTAWLRRRIAEAADDTADEERSRRLESDADAVQVLTIHRSKGLEFPIVYFPYLWEPGYIPRSRARRLPRPRRGRPAHDRRRAGGRGVRAPQGAGADRAARRGPAARLRRADPRAPPGGRLVGGLVRQPQLGARAAAVRARGGRRDRRGRDEHARPTARSPSASTRSPRGAPGCDRRRARRCRACRSPGAGRRARPPR